MQHETVVVVAGGGAADSEALRGQTLLNDAAARGAPVIAADGGVDRALELGLRVDVVVGDFDSASAEGLAAAEAAGARVVRHPEEKDATDLELALNEAASLEPRRIIVVAAPGGRLDHLVGGMMVLASDAYSRFDIDVLIDSTRMYVVRRERSIEGVPGQVVSLLPMHGSAEGVRTQGLIYPLRGETLHAGSSRGISNVFAAERARVGVDRGAVLVLCPGSGQ